MLGITDEIAAAQRVVAALDEGIVTGLARLTGPARDAALGLGGLFAGTPLEAKASDASAALGRAMPTEEHALVLATCRASLLGAAHDALLAHACEVLGRPAPIAEEPAAVKERSSEDQAPLRNARHWLLELALAGLAQVSADAVAPFASSLAQLSERPSLQRPAALLSGLYDELLELLPLASADEAPVPRWPDLWSASMLATRGVEREVSGAPVSGTLRPLGVDLKHHDHLLSAVVYGVLEGGSPRVVRTSFAGWKVDALSLAEVMRALPDPAMTVLSALAQGLALEVEGTLRGGELICASAKERADSDPFALGPLLESAATFSIAPEDRHPVQLAIPVVLESCSVAGGRVKSGALELRIAEERVSPAYGAVSALDQASAMIGLVRFDDGWALQPLAAKLGKKKTWDLSAIIAAASSAAKSGDPLAILRERASMLLRRS